MCSQVVLPFARQLGSIEALTSIIALVRASSLFV
jgi:hypothetical protein